MQTLHHLPLRWHFYLFEVPCLDHLYRIINSYQWNIRTTSSYISSTKEAVAARVEGGGDSDEGGKISTLGGEVKKKTSKKAIGMFLIIISLFFWEPESI